MSKFNSKMTGYEILERKVLDSEKILKEGNSIIEVETLPISNISRKTFYKTSAGIFYYDGSWHNVSEGGSDLSKIDALDTSYSQKVVDLDIYDDGIRLEDKFSLMDEDQNDIVMGDYMGRIPIVPGENVTFEKDNTNKVIKINATGGSGGVSSWNNLTDRPFYDASVKETVSRNNGSIGGSISYTTNSGEEYLATRYSEKTYTKDQLIGSVVNTTNGQYTIDSSHIVEESSNGLWIKLTDLEHIWVAYTPNYQPDKFSSTFPVGTYLSTYISPGGMEVIGVNSLDINYTDVKCIDEKYIPDTIARKGKASAFIDVDTLPTENINANAFYRVKEYYIFNNGTKNGIAQEDGSIIPYHLHVVDVLPENPIVFTDASTSEYHFYFRTSDSTAHMYVDETLSELMGGLYPVGWNDMSQGMSIISSEAEATDPDKLYVVKGTPKLYAHNGTEWVEYVTKAQLDEAVANAGSSGGKLYKHLVEISKDLGGGQFAQLSTVTVYSSKSTPITLNDLIFTLNDISMSGMIPINDIESETIRVGIGQFLSMDDTNALVILYNGETAPELIPIDNIDIISYSQEV